MINTAFFFPSLKNEISRYGPSTSFIEMKLLPFSIHKEFKFSYKAYNIDINHSINNKDLNNAAELLRRSHQSR